MYPIDCKPESFTARERKIIKALQTGIPLCPRPFARLAEEVGCNENEVVDFLHWLGRVGIVRRFSAVLSHTRAGFTCNALLVWNVRGLSAEMRSQLGRSASEFSFISHCYLRAEPSPAFGVDWPYQLYAMMHAPDSVIFERQIEGLQAVLQAVSGGKLKKPLVLHTLHEYKKSVMLYFK